MIDINRLLNRITIDLEICHGKPCVRGMRWPVEVIIDMLGSGITIEQILDDHKELEIFSTNINEFQKLYSRTSFLIEIDQDIINLIDI